MQHLYETEAYAERNPDWHEEDSPWKAAHCRRILTENGVTFETLCEVGCGTGEILLELSRAFPHGTYTGYDISPHAYARAAAKSTRNVGFRLGSVTDDRDAHFDVIVVADVFEHVENYLEFLKSLRSHSRYKVFHIPLDLSVQSLLRGWPIMALRESVGHLHYFCKETALASLRDCGYRIIDHRYTASRLELPRQALSSRMMKVPRKICYALNPDLAVRILGGYSLMVLAE